MNAKLKKGIWSIIFCLTLHLSLFAQDRRERYEQIEAIKVAFITKKLGLTTEEA